MRSKPALISIGCMLACQAVASTSPGPVWTDPDLAAAENPLSLQVGEYLAAEEAMQVTLLKDGRFLAATYQGGLPGAGWDGSAIRSEVLTAEALAPRLNSFTRTERTSPTLGAEAPPDAVLKFPDDFTAVTNGIMMVGGRTKKDLASFRMHLEFMVPLKPGINPSNQDRGNSGIYIFNNYELQVIDSFALDLNTTNNAVEAESLNTQWCGALYKLKAPAVHMAYPPLCWQTFDIEFRAPVFENARRIRNARITIYHNGVCIHDDVELESGTGQGAKRKQLAAGPVFFQHHGNPVLFRNIWATEMK
jgi:hypothetical protein